MYEKRFLVESRLMTEEADPEWAEAVALVRTRVAREAVDEADRLLLLEILGIAA
jgi:hypothetical protein